MSFLFIIMIRPAKPSDSKRVAKLIVQAMDDLALKFCNSEHRDTALPLFEHFFHLTDNQYSFQNTLVYENENGVVGAVGAYDGAMLKTYRKPFFDYLAEHFDFVNLNPEPETESGEFYLDTISVDPAEQGKGIGKALIIAAIDWAKKLGHRKVGLLVEINNSQALNLYQKMGFEIIKEKPFMGGLYHHMTMRL